MSRGRFRGVNVAKMFCVGGVVIKKICYGEGVARRNTALVENKACDESVYVKIHNDTSS